ncbi:hypothetical protein [Pontibacter sp. H249]|uniref:hypothetical protein n=1 Tax=Pontibacter sp. H249 TaxID=3133420 RepID=UPI0030BE25EC
MSRLPHYTTIASNVFNAYLDSEINLDEFLQKLREIEMQVNHDEEEETYKVLWFRFFEGDPLQTTIQDIEKDLTDPSHPNSRILLQGILMGLQAGELEVNCS